jgi:hypothetical protein
MSRTPEYFRVEGAKIPQELMLLKHFLQFLSLVSGRESCDVPKT